MKKNVLISLIICGALSFSGCFFVVKPAQKEETVVVTEKVETVSSVSAPIQEEVICSSSAVVSTSSITTSNEELTKEEAKNIVLKYAGFEENQVSFLRVEKDYEDDWNRLEYEVDFVVGEKEYSYTIDAFTGELLNEEVESIYD